MPKRKRNPQPGKPTKTDRLLIMLGDQAELIRRLRVDVIELSELVRERQTIKMRLVGVPRVKDHTVECKA